MSGQQQNNIASRWGFRVDVPFLTWDFQPCGGFFSARSKYNRHENRFSSVFLIPQELTYIEVLVYGKVVVGDTRRLCSWRNRLCVHGDLCPSWHCLSAMTLENTRGDSDRSPQRVNLGLVPAPKQDYCCLLLSGVGIVLRRATMYQHLRLWVNSVVQTQIDPKAEERFSSAPPPVDGGSSGENLH